MQKLVIATQNKDKLIELKALLRRLDLDIVPISSLMPGFNVIEDRDTILGNAAKKALEASKITGLIALADDTGLFIDALNGEPGVYAARFAGEKCTYAENRKKTLMVMKAIDNRRAEFRSVVVLADTKGVIAYKEGIVAGYITSSERGSKGFGYDAIFEVEGTGKTYAEMNNEEKNTCSHRSKALKAIVPLITSYLQCKEI